MKVAPLPGNDPEYPLETSFNLSPQDMTDIVEAYRSRKAAEELDLLLENGGVQGLIERLKTNKDQGLSTHEDQTDRISIFGLNKRPQEKIKNFFEICIEALEDVTLRILLVCGLISLFIGIFYDDHPQYGWIEGFAIIIAVVVVVSVTATNELQKQSKFTDLKKQHQDNRSQD